MSVFKALKTARAAGIEIELDGDNLVLEAPSKPSSNVLGLLSRYKPDIVTLLRSVDTGWSGKDWRAFYEERAAILKYDGGQIRADAEAQAFECCIVEWLNQHPEPSDPGSCAWCGEPTQRKSTILPFGTDVYGHTWLHAVCWNDWRRERRERARQDLDRQGVIEPRRCNKTTSELC